MHSINNLPDFISRRDFLTKTGTAVTSLAILVTGCPVNSSATQIPKPDSRFEGVQIGAITYSFRKMPSNSIEQILQYTVEAGLSAVELMGYAVENYAGRPANAGREELASWRTTVDMQKFKEVRKMFDKAGVSIYAYKQPDALHMYNTNAEIEYVMKVAKIMGAKAITRELPPIPELSKRIGDLASKHKIYASYHAHTQASDTAWDLALSQSPYNSINLDCGHYIAAGAANTKESLLAFIDTRHERITSLHMKDRQTKANGATNLQWGKGDTPIKEILLLLKNKKYDIPVSIELEYQIPTGSDAVKEVKKCMQYAKEILLSR